MYDWDANDLKQAREEFDKYFRVVLKKIYKKLSGKIYRKTGANPNIFTKISDTIIAEIMKKDLGAFFNLLDIKTRTTQKYQEAHDALTAKMMEQIGKRVKVRPCAAWWRI